MTTKWKKIPLFGEGVYAGDPTVTRERRLNCYYQVRKDKDRTAIVVRGTPGMRKYFTVNSASAQGARGILGNATSLYMVIGNQFLSVQAPSSGTGNGPTVATGTLNSLSGPVSMATNPTQVCIVDGANGWIFTPSTGAFTQILSAGFPNGAKTVASLNGFFICEMPGTNNFFVSAFNDGTTWSALSFAQASQYTDGLIAMDTVGGMLIPFSSTHIEFWQNSGLVTEPFTYIPNSATEYGLAAPFSRVHFADSIGFLTKTREGGLQIAQIVGYQVKVISTPDIDQILQGMSTTVDCEALAYQVNNSKFAQFTFPTEGRSLLFEAATGLWSEAQTGITQGYAARHIGRWSTQYAGQTLVSDYASPTMYRVDPNTFTDNGNTIVREVITRCGINDQNYFRVGQMYFDMEVGVGLSDPTLQGYNPMLALQVARDSRNFGPEQWVGLGKLAQTKQRVTRRRCGRARFFHTRIRMTDPVKFVISGGAMITSSASGQKQAGRR